VDVNVDSLPSEEGGAHYLKIEQRRSGEVSQQKSNILPCDNISHFLSSIIYSFCCHV